MKEKKIYKVTAEGSIALLALGHKGVLAWKKAIQEEKKSKKSSTKNEK